MRPLIMRRLSQEDVVDMDEGVHKQEMAVEELPPSLLIRLMAHLPDSIRSYYERICPLRSSVRLPTMEVCWCVYVG